MSKMKRRTFLATTAGVAASSGVVSAHGSASSTDPTNIDIKVWATDATLDNTGDIDPREIVVDQLKTTYKPLAYRSDDIDSVNITTGPRVTGLSDEGGYPTFVDWSVMVGDREESAKDSNLLLHHGFDDDDGLGGYAEIPTCHLPEFDTYCGDENAAVLWESFRISGEWDRYVETKMDPDADGYFEDANGDGASDVTDVQWVYSNQKDNTLNKPTLFDFNGDSKTDVVDVQKLYNEVKDLDVGPYSPRAVTPQLGVGFARKIVTAVHEVGHNLGLQHSMGNAEEMVVEGQEFLVISPMLGSYYMNEDKPPYPGDENYFGKTIPEGDVYLLSYLLNEDIYENAEDIIYDRD